MAEQRDRLQRGLEAALAERNGLQDQLQSLQQCSESRLQQVTAERDALQEQLRSVTAERDLQGPKVSASCLLCTGCLSGISSILVPLCAASISAAPSPPSYAHTQHRRSVHKADCGVGFVYAAGRGAEATAAPAGAAQVAAQPGWAQGRAAAEG